MSPTPDPRAIRELAYRLWEMHGRQGESAEAHWLEAERQLTQVHQEITRSSALSPNAGTATQSDPSSEYSPEHPPVNAEFKWAAAELNASTRR